MQWLKDHDADRAARRELANMYLDQNKYDEAQKQYERVDSDVPNDAIVLNNLAWIYEKKGDKRAHDMAEQAFNLAPTPERADTLGWIMVNDGEAKAGVRYLSWACASLPQNPTIVYHFAVALKATGAKDEARSLLERLVKSDAKFDGKDDARRLLQEMQRG